MSGANSWWLDVPHRDELWCFHENLFSPDECRTIRGIGNNKDLVNLAPGSIAGEPGYARLDESVRKSTIGWIPTNDQTFWIFQRLTSAIIDINKNFFKYDLTHIESIQFTVYNQNSNFYGKHIDSLYESNASRKLSLSVQLSDPSEYEGGDLKLHIGDEPTVLPKNHGMCFYFPSWTLHEVTPVTKGTRYSLVAWVCGPRFR